MQSAIHSTCCSIERQHVGEHRRAAWTGDGEQVREARDPEPEIGARAGRPCRRAGAGRLRPRMSIRSSAPVMASKPVAKHERVDLVVPTRDADARARDRLDRRPADVDQRDVRPVEGLVVAGVDAQPLAADHRERGASFGDRRVVHDRRGSSSRTNSAAVVVGRPVDQQVANAPRKASPPCSQRASYSRSPLVVRSPRAPRSSRIGVDSTPVAHRGFARAAERRRSPALTSSLAPRGLERPRCAPARCSSACAGTP